MSNNKRRNAIEVASEYIEEKLQSKNIIQKKVLCIKRTYGSKIDSFIQKNIFNIILLKETITEKRESIQKKKKNYSHKYTISFCIPCMNRLEHIKKTLPRNLEDTQSYENREFILLDYNSADGLDKWVKENLSKYLKNKTLKLYQTKKPQEFHMSKAKNAAHNLASGDIVCNLDADNYVGKGFAEFINQSMNEDTKNMGSQTIAKGLKKYLTQNISGRIFLFKKDFDALGGYDESFRGRGYEDVDFHHRALNYGLQPISIPVRYLESIHHNNALRMKNISKNMSVIERENKQKMEYHLEQRISKVKNKTCNLNIKRIKL